MKVLFFSLFFMGCAASSQSLVSPLQIVLPECDESVIDCPEAVYEYIGNGEFIVRLK